MAILGDQLSEESRTNTGREVFIISVRNPTGAAWRMMISGYPNDDSIAAKVESLLSLLEAAEEEPRDTARILDACSQVRNFWLLGSKSKTAEEDMVSTLRKSLRD